MLGLIALIAFLIAVSLIGGYQFWWRGNWRRERVNLKVAGVLGVIFVLLCWYAFTSSNPKVLTWTSSSCTNVARVYGQC